MSKTVKCVLINVDVVLISEIVNIDTDVDDMSGASCKLVNPYLFKKAQDSDDFYLEPWPEVTYQREIQMRAEDILTIADPLPKIVEKYLELTT
jgi:hypothetical protein